MTESKLYNGILMSFAVGAACGGIIGAYESGKKAYNFIKNDPIQDYTDLDATGGVAINALGGMLIGVMLGSLWPISLPSYIAIKRR